MALFEGKANRANLTAALGDVREEQQQLKKPFHIPATGRQHKVEWFLSADLYCLMKIMHGDKDKGCQNIFNMAKRKINVDKSGKRTGENWDSWDVWEDVPNTPLPDCLFECDLHHVVYCVLHAKCRIWPKFMQLLLDEVHNSSTKSEGERKCGQLQTSIMEVIGDTFRIQQVGKACNRSGKTANRPKIGSVRGDMADKLTYASTEQLEKIIASVELSSDRAKKVLEMWQAWVRVYGVMNSPDAGMMLHSYKRWVDEWITKFRQLHGDGKVTW